MFIVKYKVYPIIIIECILDVSVLANLNDLKKFNNSNNYTYEQPK
jgi:hypothetical protein